MAIVQPTDISGCFGWYRASSIGWGASSGYVTYWADESGSGNYLDMYRAISGTLRAPVYFPNVKNGLPAVYFNGANRLDSSISIFSARNYGLPVAPSSITAFSVYAPADVEGAQAIFGYNNDLQDIGDKNSFIVGIGGKGVGGIGDVINNNQSGWFFGWGRDSGFGQWRFITSGSGIRQAKNQWVARTDRFNYTTKLFNFNSNGVTAGTGVASTSYNLINYLSFGIDDETLINVPRYYKGYLAEVVIYNRRLDHTETSDVEVYLRNKYAIDSSDGSTLFIEGTPQTETSSSGITEYIRGYSSSSGDANLFVYGANIHQTGCNLYVRGLSTQSSGTDLYTSSSLAINSSTPLFTLAGVGTSYADLYIYGFHTNSGYMSLYTASTSIYDSGHSLFIYGTIASGTSSIPLYIGSSESYSTGNILFISASTPFNSSSPLYIGSASNSGKTNNLYIPGNFDYTNRSLYIYGKDASSGSIYLYTNAATPIGEPIDSNTSGKAMASGYMGLFLKQTPVPTGIDSFPLYLSAPTTLNTNLLYNTAPLHIYAIGDGELMPLYLQNSSSNPEPSSYMPLYLKTTELINTLDNSLTAFILNDTVVSGRRLKLYIRGDGVMDGASIYDDSMNLFLKQNQGESSNINMYLSASSTGVLSSALFTKGVYTYDSGKSLYISGGGKSGVFNLYIDGGRTSSSGVSLYTYTQPSTNDSKILYIYGF